MNYKELLVSKGFSLNEYPEGKFWEFIIENNEELKEKICKIFRASVDFVAQGTDIDTLILQCAEDFTRCLFYYDCNPFDMETEEFMKCIEKNIGIEYRFYGRLRLAQWEKMTLLKL